MPWEVRFSNSKKLPYFYNAETKDSSWEPPPNFTEEQVMALPGAELLKNVSSSKPGQVRASHLLVKHKDSRRPSSWKEQNITRSKEEAIEILRGYQEQINKVAEDDKINKFAELASAHSDCSSHSKQGDLGWFGPGMMQKPFEEATFGLEVGGFSDVISTDSGVHIILRSG